MNLLRPVDRYLRVKDLWLHCLDWGGEGRPPLLLLHGFTGHAHAWDTLSIALQPHFHVYALDQRGHGDSEPATVYNPIVAFDDISGVLDQLRLTSLVIVGLSMGGRNAMYFAAKQPDAVKKLVIVDIGPEISKRAGQASAGPPEPDTWESIEQAAQHLYRSNPYPGIHYYRWVVSHSLKPGPDGGARVDLAPERQAPALAGRHRLVGAAQDDRAADPGAARRLEHGARPRRGRADGPRSPARQVRRDPARGPHAARGQSRGRPRRAQGLPGLLSKGG